MTVHDSTILERELPDELADQFAAIGLAHAPETVGEWIELTTSVLEDADLPTDLEVMCTSDHGRHEATFGEETRHVHCVLDTLLVPFVIDADEPVTARSKSPESGEIIEILVTREEISTSPETAVMSFGIATDIEEPIDDPIDPTVIYELFCPYVNAFTSREEYKQWADETEEAITIGMPMEAGFALARAIEESPTVPPNDH